MDATPATPPPATAPSAVTPYAMNLPWVESPFFESILRSKNLPPHQERLARQYHQEGYIVLEDVVSDALARRIVSETLPLFTNAPDGPRSHYRVEDAWAESPAVKELASNASILEVLGLFYDRRPFPFHTLSFKHGSQQAGHSDQIHFSSLPARFMCGAWAALEDVDDANGPLFYYPGSHRLPEYDLYDLGLSVENANYPEYERFVAALMSERGFERRTLRVKRGSVLIWSSNIVHGGAPIAQRGRTRHSQVTHYFFDDCIYYTPVFSNRTMGEYELREDVIDIRTGKRVHQTYNGRPFRPVTLEGGRRFIHLGNAGQPGASAAATEGPPLDPKAKAEELERELARLLASRSYRLGRLLTEPYRMVKAGLRGLRGAWS